MAIIRIDKKKFDLLIPEQIREIKQTLSKILNEPVEVVGVDFNISKDESIQKKYKSNIDF